MRLQLLCAYSCSATSHWNLQSSACCKGHASKHSLCCTARKLRVVHWATTHSTLNTSCTCLLLLPLLLRLLRLNLWDAD
jgi:hypothetical protein